MATRTRCCVQIFVVIKRRICCCVVVHLILMLCYNVYRGNVTYTYQSFIFLVSLLSSLSTSSTERFKVGVPLGVVVLLENGANNVV